MVIIVQLSSGGASLGASFGRHVDLRGRLGEVAVPTLVTCGARDRANLGPSREIAAGVPSAELRIVPEAVHLWNLQQPELFNETVAEFVARS